MSRLFRIALATSLLCLFPAKSFAQQTINVPADQPTIQLAINAAKNGDTVLVAPGTYYENINFNGKAITVTSSAGPATTIIDGGGSRSTVIFQTAESRNSVLSNFTIRNGSSVTGSMEGGGIWITSGSPTIQNNTITANSCHAIDVDRGAPLIQGNEISATTTGTNISCQWAGSAVFLYSYTTGAIVSSDVIENNVDGVAGAGILVDATAGNNLIQGNIIRDNQASSPSALGGGGIALINTIDGVSIIQNLIYGNYAREGGGGIDLKPTGSGNANVANVFVVNNTIANNSTGASAPNGATEVFIPSFGYEFAFINNIISGTSASIPAFTCTSFGAGLPAVEDHNDIYNPTGNIYASACPHFDNAYGNISVDPGFVNPVTGDFHLLPAASTVDVGNNSAPQLPATDLDGDPRIQDATSKTYPVVDMGAYEYTGAQDANPTYITLTPSTYFDYVSAPVTFTAQLSSRNGVPTGVVTFYQNGLPIGTGTIDPNGISKIIVTPANIGFDIYTVEYGGQVVFPPAVSVELAVVVQNAPSGATITTLTSLVNPAPVGQPVQFTATVTSASGTPTGSIVFADNGVTLYTGQLLGGNTPFTTSWYAIGTQNMTATFIPTGTFLTSTASLSEQIISPYPTSINLTATPNLAAYQQPVSITATLVSTSATPFGIFTLSDGTTVLASEIISASNWPPLTVSSNTLSVGTHNLTASYTPAFETSNTAASSATAALVIQPPPTVTALTATPTSTTSFQNVTLTATVTPSGGAAGTPTGAITFFSGATPLGTASVNSSIATLTINPPAGSYTLTAQYAGTPTFAASTSNPVAVTIARADTALTVSATPNPQAQNQNIIVGTVLTYVPPIPVTATFAHSTGTYTIYDSATAITNPDATIPLTAGTHHLTAAYSGDANYSPSSSPIFDEVITPQDYTITAPPITIQTEHHAPLAITVTTVGSLTDTLTLSCANLPRWVTCTFSQSVLNLTSASSTYTTTVLIDTDEVPYFARNNPSPGNPHSRLPIALAATLLGAFALLRRKSLPIRLLSLALAAAGLATMLTGCSGQYPQHTAPGTYNIQINGITSTTHIAHSTTVALTVTQ